MGIKSFPWNKYLLVAFLSLFLFLNLAFTHVFALKDNQVISITKSEPPSLPSSNAEDYIIGLYYMFYTGDYSLLDAMVGQQGTQYHIPFGVGFFPPGKDNTNEVRFEFDNATGLSNAQCLGLTPPKSGKFTVFFSDIHFQGQEENVDTFFLFMENNAGEWELFVIGYLPQESRASNISGLEYCPINEFEIPDERGAPAWFLSGDSDSVDSLPIENDEIYVEEPEEESFFRRFFPQAHASEICNPIRDPFDDKDPNFTQCTEYVQRLRPDVLCWLPKPTNKIAVHAHLWDDYATNEEYGVGIVTVSEEPLVGDIVVWNQNCGDDYKIYGHVAIVTNTRIGNDGRTYFDVDEANADSKGTISIGIHNNIPVDDCMSFIHEPGVGINNETAVQKEEPGQTTESGNKKVSWWQSFLCFINPWCP